MMNFLETARLFSDCWYLYKKYYGQEMEEEMWLALLDESRNFYEKYGRRFFAKEIIVALINEVERIDKARIREIKREQ